MRLCRKCNTEKSEDCFRKNGQYLRHICNDCGKKQATDYYYRDHETNKAKRTARSATGKEWHRNYRLEKLFGITSDEYDQMLTEQNGACAICLNPPDKKRLAVDHCHETGKVRKLLCQKCNTALGLLKENEQAIENMLKYVRGFNESTIH